MVPSPLTFDVRGRGPVLNALEQPDLAEVAQSMNLNLEVSGSSDDIRISPLRLDLVVAGPSIPDSPQTLTLNADTNLNLANDTMNVSSLTLAGLGLNMSGNVSATNLSEAARYRGALKIPAFNARSMLEQLNQNIETSDASVLQKVELGFAFNASANDVAIRNSTRAG